MDKELFRANILDHKPGLFLERILFGLFKRVSLDEPMTEALKRMNREGTVVYAIKYRGRLDYLMYHYNFRMRRLPYPKLAFSQNISLLLPLRLILRNTLHRLGYLLRHGELPDPYRMGFYRDAIRNGTTSLIFLVNPKRFLRQFVHAEPDDLQLLLETQKEMDRPIFVVPQLVLYKKTPEMDAPTLGQILFGFKEQPGVIRKTVLFFRHHRRAFIDFGEPVNLQQVLAETPPSVSIEEAAVALRERLVDRIDAQKRIMLGPIMKSRQQLKETVLRDEGIGKLIDRMAERDPKQVVQKRKNAGDYFDEIAADFNIAYIQLFHRALSWFFKKLFDGIDTDMEGLARLREWARKGPLVYVPSHKSHIDYLVLNYVLYNYNMHIPRVAAGKNLAFWPMGYIFRRSGAFFIRRTFRGAKLYRAVFNRYIKALIEEGHPLEFFIEGGRSRSGKLILPKIGFLTILLHAFQEGYCRDLIFVPASISYDRILEEKAFLKEMAGGEKAKESFRQIIRARHFLKRTYGKIYIRFGEPVSLKEYLESRAPATEKIHRHLAFHLIRSINRVTLVTPLALVASAVLTAHRAGFHMDELKETSMEYLAFLIERGAPLAASLDAPEEAIEQTVDLLISWKVVSALEVMEGEQRFYYVDDERKVELEFYKNSVIHHFLHHALVAVSLLQGREEVKPEEAVVEDYRFLRTLFQKEFIVDTAPDDRARVQAVLGDFVKAGLVREASSHEGYQITRLGHDRLPAWSRFAKTFMESYWIAIQALLQDERKAVKKGEELKNMKLMGLKYHKLGVIEHIESVSQLTFRTALDRFTTDRVREKREENGPTGEEKELLTIGRRLYDLIRAQS
ncbi:MAG: 1-acyl-sn-glycerol-3-phosphate acyltransferase [Deltaproteobacteria bacterium]|nr:1-acyl-sn-glycerol-3-phosphate acyltransferase [Deltaproteobacteria bacterium]